MEECLRLAARGKGRVSPNPMVGALLWRGGRVIARGYHRTFGAPHAETECLRRAGRKCRGSVLYVNLEPCSHFGQTPPCADAIIRAGIRHVVVGMQDPNPLVAGRGIRKLRAAGISVRTGILRQEAAELNRHFVRHITRRYPYVHVKIAQSLDGKIAPSKGRTRTLTSILSRRRVHAWRAEYDAVLVGAGTIRSDNPRLDARLVRGRDPAVVILDGNLGVQPTARVFASARRRRIMVFTSLTALQRRMRTAGALRGRGVMVVPLDGRGTSLPLKLVLKTLYRLRIGSVLVEGGQQVFTSFLHEGLADEISIFVAPVILGKGIPGVTPRSSIPGFSARSEVSAQLVGRDILYTLRNP